MKKILFCVLMALMTHVGATAQNTTLYMQSPVAEPLHEMRAVWLTTIGGIDWPHNYSQSLRSEQRQKAELCDILDKLVAAGVNTVLLQTRIRATTIFPSAMEPWDGCLSGFPSKSPGYDALAFAIEECHRRGMKLHAWVVSIPVGKWDGTGCKALRKTVPGLLKKINGEGFMNPEVDGTADYLARFCRDIVERYDVDGIHLDYIRYPETWKVIRDRDRGRENITRIVRAVHDAVKALKPWVMMSCSPVGKYADTKRQWSHGWNARDVVCQDAAQWLQDGLMDALFPMMYFRGDNFYPFVVDWKERSAGKIVTPGLGIYFLDKREKDWDLSDITREMHVSRQLGMGTCLFRSKFFTDDTKGLYGYTSSAFSRYPALQPAMTWYNSVPPSMPTGLSVKTMTDGSRLLSWQGDSTSAPAITYNVYGSSVAPVDTKDARNLLLADYDGMSVEVPAGRTVRYLAVTATDRYGNESEPCQSFAGKTGETDGMRSASSGLLFEDDGRRVWLDGGDVVDGQLVEVCSVVGTPVMTCFVRTEAGRPYLDVPAIAPGHYIAYLINKKGFRHRLGMFSRALR